MSEFGRLILEEKGKGKLHSYLKHILDGADETDVVFDHLRELVEVRRRL